MFSPVANFCTHPPPQNNMIRDWFVPPYVETDDAMVDFFANSGALAFLSFLLFCVCTVALCCCARPRMNEFDVPVEGFNCGCCCFQSSSMAKLRRLAIVVTYCSIKLWFTAWATEWSALSYPISFITLVIAVDILCAVSRRTFIQSRVVQNAAKIKRALLLCVSLLCFIAIIVSGYVFNVTFEVLYTSCDYTKYGKLPQCDVTRAYYWEMLKTTACLLYILIGCAVGLAYTLENIAMRINAVGAENGQVVAAAPPSEIPMAAIVNENEDAIDRSAIVEVQQEYMDLRGEGLLRTRNMPIDEQTTKAVAMV